MRATKTDVAALGNRINEMLDMARVLDDADLKGASPPVLSELDRISGSALAALRLMVETVAPAPVPEGLDDPDDDGDD